MSTETPFEIFLAAHDEEAWSAALATLRRSIHDVDLNATQIWFAFYPLQLCRALGQAPERERLAHQLLLQGDYELKNQIDGSHSFLYGHRFWPEVKKAIEQHADKWPAFRSVAGDSSPTEVSATSLADQILAVAREAARTLKQDESLLVGMTAVGFMTLAQTGLAAFKAAPGTVSVDRKVLKKSP
ncbi:MAG TPA: hypothetical protein VKD91_13830, partial [Pyrinomonadaceae bacterium]|nr:hypothetical protein [Pyrinomonadaceae bacterium]